MNIISFFIGVVAALLLIVSIYVPSLIWLSGMALPIATLGAFIGAMSKYYKVGAALNLLVIVLILWWFWTAEDILPVHINL